MGNIIIYNINNFIYFRHIYRYIEYVTASQRSLYIHTEHSCCLPYEGYLNGIAFITVIRYIHHAYKNNITLYLVDF